MKRAITSNYESDGYDETFFITGRKRMLVDVLIDAYIRTHDAKYKDCFDNGMLASIPKTAEVIGILLR